MYSVYVKINEDNRIVAVNSSAFLMDLTNWIKIDEGGSDKFHHAQNNYFDPPFIDENDSFCYVLKNNIPVYDPIKPEPLLEEESTETFLLELAANHEYRLCLLELGVNESDL